MKTATIGLILTLVLGILSAPLAAEAQRVARVPPTGAMEDTQARSHREMLR